MEKITQMLNIVFKCHVITGFKIRFNEVILDVITQEGEDATITYSAREIEYYCMRRLLEKGYVFKISQKKIKVFKNKNKIFETKNHERGIRQSLEMYTRIFEHENNMQAK
jgi:hypothetical protein